MIKHWNYLKYVLKHKWYVIVFGLKLRVPLWNLLIHDWSKFTPTEWSAYVWSFYGPYEYKDRPKWLVEQFDRAWLHHQHYNPHHWQYWVLREDSGNIKCIKIPEKYVREMVADWHSAGYCITGRNNTIGWYNDNKDKIKLHEITRAFVEDLL